MTTPARPPATPVRSQSSDNVSSATGPRLGREPPVWVPDSASPRCQACHRQFTFIVRRHHCRCCGRLLCSSCSCFFVPLAYLDWRVARVCQLCHQILNQPARSQSGTGHRRSNSLSSLTSQEEIVSKLVRDLQIQYFNKHSREMNTTGCGPAAIDLLPHEILSKIINYVNHSDKRICRYVSHNWYNMLATSTFYHNSVVNLSELYQEKLNTILEETYMNTRFENFRFNNCTMSFNTQFWNAMAPEMRSLELISCEITEKELSSVLLMSFNLDTLVLCKCRDLFMSGTLFSNEDERLRIEQNLVGLRRLDLSHNKYLSDVLLIKITRTTPNIRELSLSVCNIMNDAGVYKKFYPASQDIQASPSVLTWRTVVSVVASLSSTLRNLDVSSNTGVDLEMLAQVPGLNLEAINLANCGSVTMQGLLKLLEACPRLNKLDISLCRRVFSGLPETVTRVFSAMAASGHMRELKLDFLSISNISHLAAVKNLRSLEMSNLDSPGLELVKAFQDLDVSKLRNLTLKNLSAPSADIADVFGGKNFSSLRSLDLSAGGGTVSNKLLNVICKNMPNLTYLNLQNNSEISDTGVLGLSCESVHPKTLDQVKEWLVRNNKILLGSRHEQELHLAKFQKEMTSENLKEMVSLDSGLYLLNKLEMLDLSRTSITGLSLKLGVSAPDLRRLDISSCAEIDDSALYDFAIRHPRLEQLSIGYTSVSDTSIISCLSCLPRLIELDVSSCKNLSNAGVRAICQISPQLETLVLSNCQNISMETARILETSMPNLTVRTLGLKAERLLQRGLIPATPPPPPPP